MKYIIFTDSQYGETKHIQHIVISEHMDVQEIAKQLYGPIAILSMGRCSINDHEGSVDCSSAQPNMGDLTDAFTDKQILQHVVWDDHRDVRVLAASHNNRKAWSIQAAQLDDDRVYGSEVTEEEGLPEQRRVAIPYRSASERAAAKGVTGACEWTTEKLDRWHFDVREEPDTLYKFAVVITNLQNIETIRMYIMPRLAELKACIAAAVDEEYINKCVKEMRNHGDLLDHCNQIYSVLLHELAEGIEDNLG